MAEYYYTQNPESAHQLRTFTVEMGDRLLEFETDAGVFSKEHIDPGSQLLCSALPEEMEGRILDMGAGWGAMSVLILAAHPGLDLTMAEMALAMWKACLRPL